MNIKKLFNKEQITVYTSENCPYCKNTKDKLDEANIEYVEKDIKEHEDDWNKLVRLTNMPITPGVIVGDNYLFPSRDFPNPDILVKILENIKNVDGSYSLQTLERIKTLNYHISTAFNGLNQRLKAIEDQLQTKQSKTKKKKNVNKSTN